MMRELGFGTRLDSVPVDNTSTLHVTGIRTYSSREQHVALRHFFIQELFGEGRTSLRNVETEDQLADIGTKHLRNIGTAPSPS